MTDVIHRTTLEQHFDVNTPSFPTGTWIINPDLSAVASVAKKYWKISVDDVLEMTQGEKDAIDAADLVTAKAARPKVLVAFDPVLEPVEPGASLSSQMIGRRSKYKTVLLDSQPFSKFGRWRRYRMRI